VVEARLVCFGVRHGVIADHDARCLHKPGLNRVIESEIADDPGEQRFLASPTAVADTAARPNRLAGYVIGQCRTVRIIGRTRVAKWLY
jgi:hypothetical protein